MTESTHSPDPAPDNSAEQIRAALHQGRKIEAIKIYREHSGSRLKEAKEAVEQLEADLRASEPEKFTARKPAGGCSTAMLALILLAAVTALGAWWSSRL